MQIGKVSLCPKYGILARIGEVHVIAAIVMTQ